jgi:hypothetical protein
MEHPQAVGSEAVTGAPRLFRGLHVLAGPVTDRYIPPAVCTPPVRRGFPTRP